MSYNESIAARVRSNAWSAGIAAVLLCYFGFAVFQFQPVTNAFTAGDAVFNYTLRIGGIAMVLVTLMSLAGWLPTLIVDAVASFSIGLALILGGVLMGIGGGFGVNQILYMVFGATFVSAGLRNGRDYFAMLEGLRPGALDSPLPRAECLQAPSRSTPSEDSLASRLRNRPPREPLVGEGPPDRPQLGRELLDGTKAMADHAPENDCVETPKAAAPGPPPPAGGGFLASFADKPPRP